jgi:hypothetical protein
VFLVFVRRSSRKGGDERSELEYGCGREKRKMRSLERLYGVEATIFDLGGKADALNLFQTRLRHVPNLNDSNSWLEPPTHSSFALTPSILHLKFYPTSML